MCCNKLARRLQSTNFREADCTLRLSHWNLMECNPKLPVLQGRIGPSLIKKLQCANAQHPPRPPGHRSPASQSSNPNSNLPDLPIRSILSYLDSSLKNQKAKSQLKAVCSVTCSWGSRQVQPTTIQHLPILPGVLAYCCWCCRYCW